MPKGLAVPGAHRAHQLSDDVWVVAPETDQSGYAHSLSISEPLRLRKIGDKHYAVHGTPTDCVIMGVRKILPEPPDLILSGINSGANVADDVTYSGTVAGAMEGALIGIRSIALSQAYVYENDERDRALRNRRGAGARIAAEADRDRTADWRAAQRQLPELPARRGGRAGGRRARASLSYGIWVEERRDGRSLPYYWLRFGRDEPDVKPGTDLHAVRNKQISVTPLKLDMTAHELRDQLAKAIA